jgi:hypothetical protein
MIIIIVIIIIMLPNQAIGRVNHCEGTAPQGARRLLGVVSQYKQVQVATHAAELVLLQLDKAVLPVTTYALLHATLHSASWQ